jgi:DNA-binding winged helix-turn-helix (wHTH) protein
MLRPPQPSSAPSECDVWRIPETDVFSETENAELPTATDMEHRFGDFALDTATRTLTHRGKPVAVQPRVFDLLAYLVAHAGRVVPKDELMDALWPDIHVTEASLQRAVSMARRALSVGDMESAIRNYVRHGYRFAVDEPRIELLETAQSDTGSALQDARDAASARRWLDAADRFKLAARHRDLDGADLDLWAYCLECGQRAPDAAHILALAVERHLADGRSGCAARSAAVLAKIHLERASIAVARAWIDRAAGLVPDTESCEAKPLVLWMRSRLAAFQGFPEEALELASEAFLEAEACDNEGLKALCLAYMGFYNAALGRVEEGAEQQDLAAAIALSGRADAVTGALIYCNILWTCRNFADWSRARQWSAGFETWCSGSYAETTGSCDLHRAEVTGVQDDLQTALRKIDAAIAKLAEEEAWALGEGHRIRGDVHAMIGNKDAARADYDRAYALGWDAEPGNALLLAETGHVDAALSALERSLAGSTWFHLQRRTWLNAHRAWIAARHDRHDVARAVIDELGFDPGHPTPSAPAVHALLAEAQAGLMGDNISEQTRLLLLARQLWTSAGFDFHEARLRQEIAQRLHTAGDVHGANAELAAADRIARRIGAMGLQSAAMECMTREMPSHPSENHSLSAC